MFFYQFLLLQYLQFHISYYFVLHILNFHLILFDNIEKFGTDGFISFFKSLKAKAQSPLTIKSPDIMNFKDKEAMMQSIKSNYKDIYVPLIKFIKLTEDKDGNDILETKYRKVIDEFINFVQHHKNSTKPVPISPSKSEALAGGTTTP